MPRLLPPLLAASLLFVSCEFRSRRASWHPAPGVTYKLRYAAETRAKADGSWGSAPYVSSAKAEFTVKAATDSAKGQIELTLAADTLDFKASERPPEEDAYMDGRLRKYHAKLTLSRTGQAVAFEEEPAQPPVDFTPLAIGRLLTYAFPAFPDAALRQGARWDIVQPLLDKFHPDSRVAKHYTLSAIRQTPDGELATCLVEMEAFLAEDLGDTAAVGPSLKGSGKVVFNLAKGIPESAELELTGRFQGAPPPAPGDSSRAAPAHPLKLQQKLEIAFSD